MWVGMRSSTLPHHFVRVITSVLVLALVAGGTLNKKLALTRVGVKLAMTVSWKGSWWHSNRKFKPQIARGETSENGKLEGGPGLVTW